jgi:hypothetical protein
LAVDRYLGIGQAADRRQPLNSDKESLMFKSAFVFTVCLTALPMSGCYSPGGGFMARSGGPKTYQSTELMQKTITMIDTRNGRVFFGPLELPPGKQLVIDFDAGEGDDPVHSPDLLHWEVLDQGSAGGRLHNALSVPNGASRRIEVTLNRGVKFATENAQYRPLRTDEIDDRPEWWTPEGGPVPKDQRTGMYDD